MENNLKGKVVLLTGGGSGIGREIAKQLAKEEAKIILFGGKREGKLKETKAEIEELTSCFVVPGDLTELIHGKVKIQEIVKIFGQIDILINNAGMALNSPFEKITEEQYDKIMNINVKVPYFLTQQVLPYLKQSNFGTIINISSVVGHAGYPQQTAYVASKHAILGFTKSLAREVYKENVRVHAICPGGVYTDMVKVARPDLTEEGMILPEDIADIVTFLLKHRGNAVIDEINVHRVSKEPFL